MFPGAQGLEMGALSAAEHFSGYAVRHLKPEVTQSWRVGSLRAEPSLGPGAWREGAANRRWDVGRRRGDRSPSPQGEDVPLRALCGAWVGRP